MILYVRFPLNLRNVEDLLHERGVEISHETVRFWWSPFDPMFAAKIRRQRISRLRAGPEWCWHLDLVREDHRRTPHLWRAVDLEDEVLESSVTKTRDKKAAMKFLKKFMKRHGWPKEFVTDLLQSYGAAMREVGADDKHVTSKTSQQPVGEFALAVEATRAGHAPLPTDEKPAEIRIRPRLRHQPFQPRSIALPSPAFQEKPHRGTGRVASTRCGLSLPRPGKTETGPHLSDSTASHLA